MSSSIRKWLSSLALGATCRLFRRQCPEWLTPALIESAGYTRLPASTKHRDVVFEKLGAGGVRFSLKVTCLGEFRLFAGHQGYLVGYSQHHGSHSSFLAEVTAFEREAYYARKIALAA